MSLIEAILLGLLQGLTEFIPVSSSGHLVLAHELFGIDGGLTFDVALHIGTLMALIIFFWRDIRLLILGILGKNEQRRLAWLLALATVPAVIAGVILQSAAESTFRSVPLVSINLIVVALVMLLAERLARGRKLVKLDSVNRNQALAMGFAQALAIVPGVSRSGSTITTGLLMGLDRVAATRFSFLLAMPITLGAILKVFMSDNALANIRQENDIFVVGVVSALISGLFAIRFLLQYLAKHNLTVFAYYRIALGALALLALTLR